MITWSMPASLLSNAPSSTQDSATLPNSATQPDSATLQDGECHSQLVPQTVPQRPTVPDYHYIQYYKQHSATLLELSTFCKHWLAHKFFMFVTSAQNFFRSFISNSWNWSVFIPRLCYAFSQLIIWWLFINLVVEAWAEIDSFIHLGWK